MCDTCKTGHMIYLARYAAAWSSPIDRGRSIRNVIVHPLNYASDQYSRLHLGRSASPIAEVPLADLIRESLERVPLVDTFVSQAVGSSTTSSASAAITRSSAEPTVSRIVKGSAATRTMGFC